MTQSSTPESTALRDRLKKKNVRVADINRFLAYVRSTQQQEAADKIKKEREGKTASMPVTSNNDDMLYTLFVKFWNLGLVIDGVSIVITGRAMAMVTFHGYKNKVLQTYPDAKFDIQLVREGDDFSISKDSGKVAYRHKINDPFGSNPIVGAYCIISIGGRDYFEGLGNKDFQSMKAGSKQSYLWDKWDSEFWLKSVIKRACKRHFYDVVVDIDKVDNDDYGQRDDGEAPLPSQELEARAQQCTNMDELELFIDSLSSEQLVSMTDIITKRTKELINEQAAHAQNS